MDYSVLITRFLGIVFAVYGLGLLINREKIKAAGESLNQNTVLSWIVGVSQLFWGSFFVVVQQIWTNWSVMTTIAGWLIFLMGVMRIWMPGCSAKCDVKSSGGMLAFWGFIIFAWGVLMMFYGFFGTLDNMMSTMHQITGAASATAAPN